jgi:hypothetical protein
MKRDGNFSPHTGPVAEEYAFASPNGSPAASLNADDTGRHQTNSSKTKVGEADRIHKMGNAFRNLIPAPACLRGAQMLISDYLHVVSQIMNYM